ncbi:MAG: PD40 domain-containing protein, partial [Bacteroidales bacterium]
MNKRSLPFEIHYSSAILYRIVLIFWMSILLTLPSLSPAQTGSFTMEEVKSYPFPTGLAAAGSGTHIAWTFNEEGLRNIYIAEGPDFQPRKITNYPYDDGQELSNISLSADGQWIVYIRGGDFGSNWDDALPVNPTFDPVPPEVSIWSIAFNGGKPNLLGEGVDPVISPNSDRVAFVREGQIWTAPIDGSRESEKLFTARGRNGSPR